MDNLDLDVCLHAVAEVLRFLHQLKVRAQVFGTAFSRGEATINGLPCLNNGKPSNIMLWARMRWYIQLPNVLQLRCVCLLLP